MLEPLVLAIIPEDPEVRRSVALGKPVVTHSPKSRSAREFKKLAATLAKVSDVS